MNIVIHFSLALALAIGAPFQAQSSEPAAGFVYTANERGNSISTIDVGRGQVTNMVTHIVPHNVQISHDGRLLLAVGAVADMTANQPPMKMTDDGKMARGRLLIIDAETLAIGSAADIEIGRHPAHVIIDAEGKLAFVTNSKDDNILVIDVVQKKVAGKKRN